MSEVKRYNTELEKDGGLGLPSLTMRSSSIGSWVEYKDYAALEAKCASLSAQVELSIAAERAWERTMMQACGEDGPKSVADKFAELESKLETALRECRSAGITIDNLEAKCAALAAENTELKSSREILAKNTLEACNAIASAGFSHEAIMRGLYASTGNGNKYPKPITTLVDEALRDFQTPVTDAFLAEVRAQGVEMFAASLKVVGGGEHPYSAVANEFAAQLRKGGNQ